MAKSTKKAETEIVEETVETEAPVMDAEGSTEEGAPINLSLQDLNGLLTVVDLASSRGAFRGAELTQVGTVYDKLFTFLKAVSDANAEEGEEGTAETDGE
jgi:hypothetical protein